MGDTNGSEVGCDSCDAQFVHQNDATDQTVADPRSEVEVEWGVVLILTRKVSKE